MTPETTTVYWPEYKTAAWGWSRFFEGFATVEDARAKVTQLRRGTVAAEGLTWRIAVVTTTTAYLDVTPAGGDGGTVAP